jgi:hypothetical protein
VAPVPAVEEPEPVVEEPEPVVEEPEPAAQEREPVRGAGEVGALAFGANPTGRRLIAP